ncbi:MULTISPECIES: HAD-IB family phosphatase [Romboutsia]|uniref:phosphoserine phosphatase n=1 Tax=Romboutsia hominis TaxID=1507512 RepID=A0A2P2BPG4_9FIRM|nr:MULTISPECIES: HAD-IB family phosphatase [Romboutsia]MCH1959573.1 HAD-IB family phosphatase [Romboutsia hominis]MCH1970004.1 HAD-IB family phosphatase [Romboutsia hominis]MDB8791166.1 HAD-IB family phosphatase [Romboutsia sp. 1001216sp1]MDB8792347.1 HAD-IB family phosphatase [Romboutsia sp. 1001216sp1]MDB8795642.1 HAD-IB family phosphatase [Romboutsia sp. 1001216sp1]
MSKYKFVFDLDSTLTKQEILPEMAKYIGCHESISKITEDTMLGKLSFEESFLKRIEILKEIPIKKVRNIVKNITLNEELIKFILENIDRCIIITGNLDIWICELMDMLGLNDIYYSSKALTDGQYIKSVVNVIKKEDIIKEIDGPVVAIGDGSNDSKMIEYADIGIGFGAVRPIAPSVLNVCDYAFYEEEKLCQFLKRLL